MIRQKTRKYVVPLRGINSSQKYNEFVTNVTDDITNIITELSDLAALVRSSALLARQNLTELMNDVAKARIIADTAAMLDSDRYIYANPFYSADGVEYNSSVGDERRCVVDTVFGLIHLPVNGVVSLTNLPTYSGKKSIPGVDVSVETEWDDTDYSYGAEVVVRGDAENMFNGDNESFWLLRYAFPMNSDVTSVKARVTCTLPNYGVGSANVWYFKPGYVRGQEIESFESSSSLTGDTYTEIFTDLDISKPVKKFTVPYGVARVRFTVEQSNWVEENNQKVFYIGLQEVGIQYIDFDKTDWASVSPGNHIAFKIDAPDGYQFDGITNIKCTPNIFNESAYASRNIRIRVYEGEYSGTPVLDTSTSSATSVDFSSGQDTVYVEVEMRFNDTVTSGSPFEANTPAWLGDLAIVFDIS